MKKILTILFSLLYLAVGFVSVYHAISFFSISNSHWLAVVLALAFEIGQAAVLFSLLVNKSKKTMPWILMGVLTLVQVLGNVYSSYQYAALNSPEEIKYFTDSVLFFVQDPDPQVNQVMISYITGAILPIVALCMTSMIVDVSGMDHKEVTNPEYNGEEIKVDGRTIETYPVEFNIPEPKEEKNQVVF